MGAALQVVVDDAGSLEVEVDVAAVDAGESAVASTDASLPPPLQAASKSAVPMTAKI